MASEFTPKQIVEIRKSLDLSKAWNCLEETDNADCAAVLNRSLDNPTSGPIILKGCCYEITANNDFEPASASGKSVKQLLKANGYPTLKADAPAKRCMSVSLLEKMAFSVEFPESKGSNYTYQAVDGLMYTAICSGAAGNIGAVVAVLIALWNASF